MKTSPLVITVLVAAGSIAFTACKPKNDPETPAASDAGAAYRDATQAAGDAADRVGASLENTWEGIKDATYDERVAFQASAQELATKVDDKIAELQVRSASGTEAARESWDEGLDQLREARAELTEEIKDLQEATADTWDNAKAEVATAWQRVRDAYTDLEAKRTSS